MDNQTWPGAARAMLYIKRQSECYQSHTFHLPQWRLSNCLTVFVDCKGESRLNHTAELRKQPLCSLRAHAVNDRSSTLPTSGGARFMYLDEMKPRQQTRLHGPTRSFYTLHVTGGTFTTSYRSPSSRHLIQMSFPMLILFVLSHGISSF